MRTVYGKLTALAVLVLVALLLLIPMRSGTEDYLYAYPRSIRMNKGDSYAITYQLDSDHAQRIEYSAVDERVCSVTQDGLVTAVGAGSTDIHLNAQDGARTSVHVEVAGSSVTQLRLNADSIRMEKGQVSGLRASFNEGAEDTRIEWRSMDDAIAQVDSVGRVTALRGGRTMVYAITPSGLSAGADVFVHVSGDAVRITPEQLTVGTGATLRAGTYFLPDDTTDEAVRWKSDNTWVLRVTDDGEIHAVGEGEAVLSVFTQEGLSASTVVKVESAADRFDLSPSAATLERGNSLALEARFLDADGNPDVGAQSHYIEWESSDPRVAIVNDGYVTALASGTTRITASADGMTASCDVRVQVLVHEIVLDQEEVYLLRPETVNPIQLHPRLVPIDPDDPTLTWTTNNDMVANVSPDGLVTMTGGYGTAVITAHAASGAEAHMTVNVVTEIPDPNAPKETPTAAPVDDAGDDGAGGFEFGDIGDSIEGRVSVDELDDMESASGQSGSGAAPAAASGDGFSFSDIGNGVGGRVDIDDVDPSQLAG